MKNLHCFLLASLGLLGSYSAQAQLGIGGATPTAARAGTMLDVNGPIASYEASLAATGTTAPTAAITGNVGQVQLTTGTATAGPITVSYANPPTTGQRLVVYNNAAYAAAFNGQNIPAAQAVEFVYSSSGWRACGDGGNSATATNGLTKTGSATGLGGTLTGATTIASAGYNLALGGTGYLGVGTTAPGEKLEVNGNIRLGSEPATATTGWGNYLEFDGNGVNSDVMGLARYNSSLLNGGASELRLVLGDDSNAGPGVAGADRFLIGTTTGYSSPGLVTSNSFTPSFYVYGSGAVGIGGDANLSNILNVTGNATFTSSNHTTANFVSTSGDPDGVVNITVPLSNATNNITNSELMMFYRGTSQIGSIAVASGGAGVTFNTTSDKRLKENVTPTHFGLTDLMKIEVKDYNFIGVDKATRETGFLAQDLYKVYPGAVKPGDDGPTITHKWTVDYSRVTPLLVKAIQDQQAEIEALRASNTQLRAQAAELQDVKASLQSLAEQVRLLRAGSPTASTR